MKIKVLRGAELVSYAIPESTGTLLEAFDYIRLHHDRGFAYYSHQACGLGMCKGCSVRANGQVVLACQTRPMDGMVVEPSIKNVVVDLVVK